MWFFSMCTVAALVVITGMVVRLDRLPGTAGMSVVTNAAATQAAVLTDASTGLSYELLRSPWRDGCPVPGREFGWTAGEGTVADIVGTATWYEDACSGPLPARFRSGSQQAAPRLAALRLAGAVARSYFGEPFVVTRSAALLVGGQRAWQVWFHELYPGQQLAWASADCVVVVVDTGRVPAAFYASVPRNLGDSTVASLLSSLR
jgi:hypothetical protein